MSAKSCTEGTIKNRTGSTKCVKGVLGAASIGSTLGIIESLYGLSGFVLQRSQISLTAGIAGHPRRTWRDPVVHRFGDLLHKRFRQPLIFL